MTQDLPNLKLVSSLKKIMDWGNLIFISLVIGQLIPGTNQVKSTLLIFGFIGILLAYAFAYILLKE